MSEIKGTLLTIILALSVFGIVFAVVNSTVQAKADQITEKINEAGGEDFAVETSSARSLSYKF